VVGRTVTVSEDPVKATEALVRELVDG
jgi:hypothetical protein